MIGDKSDERCDVRVENTKEDDRGGAVSGFDNASEVRGYNSECVFTSRTWVASSSDGIDFA